MALIPDNTIMGNSHLAVLYRSRVCGYCSAGVPLHSIFNAGQFCETQQLESPNIKPTYGDHDYVHVDIDGNYYPCAVVVQMLEEHDRELEEMKEVYRLRAEQQESFRRYRPGQIFGV